jgi:hypothetical protein
MVSDRYQCRLPPIPSTPDENLRLVLQYVPLLGLFLSHVLD